MQLGNWNVTRDLLNQASESFTLNEKNSNQFKYFEEFIIQDEFELALSSLEELLYEIEKQKNELWIWNYLRTACENMGLKEKEIYFRNIITQLMQINKKDIVINKPDIIGEVRYLSWFEHGRLTPIMSGYTAQFKYDNLGEWSALQQLLDKKICFPDETVKINFKFSVDNVHLEKFYQDQKFEIREGSRIVATGIILEIPSEEYRK